MRNIIFLITLLSFALPASAGCAPGYLCRDFLGNTYYNDNGMKHVIERNQGTAGLLNAIAKPQTTNIIGNIYTLKQITRYQKAQDQDKKVTLKDIDFIMAKRKIKAHKLYMAELIKKYPDLESLDR